MDIPATVSVIIGVVSVAVSMFALWQASQAAKESRQNFRDTKDVLAEIDKRAAVTEAVVAENQKELLDTVKRLAIPEKPAFEEQMGMELMKSFLENPQGTSGLMDQLIEMSKVQEKDS